MSNIWDVAIVVLIVFLIGDEFKSIAGKVFYFWQVRKSARRMGLRDKGESEGGWVCSACETPVRTGIDQELEAHQYCWRCECFIVDSDDDPDPKDREELPVDDTKPATDANSSVVDITKFQRRKKAA